jgi:hypothetical protein
MKKPTPQVNDTTMRCFIDFNVATGSATMRAAAQEAAQAIASKQPTSN